ncbi:MAG: hypothetical protein FJZ49_05380 [Candidatus Verstraetearchaeota archaeon]|nr:hypothetical protein [Candidatus Verstraetearchaeota archaeon]
MPVTKGTAGSVVVAAIILILFFAPMLPFSVSSTVQVPATQTNTQNLMYISGVTIDPGYSVYRSAYIDAGRGVEYSVKASYNVDTYIFTSGEFSKYINQSSFVSVAERKEVSETRYGFLALINDTYYFVVYNPNTGFFGLGAKSVGLYSATSKVTEQATVMWNQTVTEQKYVSLFWILQNIGKT